jgi:hypothetical protein
MKKKENDKKDYMESIYERATKESKEAAKDFESYHNYVMKI